MNIAIIGAGVGGLTAAHELGKTHRVSLFEEAPDVGGHVRTVAVEAQGSVVPVDMGFIVYNERTYPRFVGLLAELGVATQASDMSLGSSCAACGIAFSSRGANGWFGSRNLLVSPAHVGLTADVLRFYRDARETLDAPIASSATLGEWLEEHRYRRSFRAHFLVPIVSAVWSTAPDRIDDLPLDYLLRFLDNHGLIGLRRSLAVARHPGWLAHLRASDRRGLPRGAVRTGDRSSPSPARRTGPLVRTADGQATTGTTPSLWPPTPTPRGASCATPTRTSGSPRGLRVHDEPGRPAYRRGRSCRASRRAWGSWNIETGDCRRPADQLVDDLPHEPPAVARRLRGLPRVSQPRRAAPTSTSSSTGR